MNCQKLCVVFLVGIIAWAASVSFGQPISVTRGPDARLVGETGQALKTANSKLRVINQDYGYAVAEGEITNHTPGLKVGYNPDVDNASETVWPVGGMYSFATQAQQLAVVSTSVSDASGGTGARTMRVNYLDGNYVARTEYVTLTGTTRANLVATDVLRVNNFNIASAGATGAAIGDIDLLKNPGTQVYARVRAGYCNSSQCVFTIPASSTGYITSWNVSCGAGAAGHWTEARLRATCDYDGVSRPGIFHLKSNAIIVDGSFIRNFTFPLKMVEKTDVQIVVNSDSGTANVLVCGGMEGWFESN
jgi:hypothetical protein